MKTLFKRKGIIVLMISGLLLSCKNNRDGYSDEIDTSKTPIKTAVGDTTNNGLDATGTNTGEASGTQGVTGAGSNSSPGASSAGATTGTATTGTGTGPGPSEKDGAAYDISSQTKKDTTKLGTKAKARVSKKQ